MTTNKEHKNKKNEIFQKNLSIPENEQVEKTKKKQLEKPFLPFDKMIYQEKKENENDIHEYEMDADQELNLGESGPRLKRRSLRDERGAGHEP
ncbi:hypothetical protein [Candidatus Protochlamydia sp. W-9]|uniref:hypothetical protein n=1 Tax=Candidatus Protochlamydia sp. W-9 TaxID=1785087 RepID=UPI00096A2F80|nr:hypothetical protein [Candidatus Protochlamydia sp. W-9]